MRYSLGLPVEQAHRFDEFCTGEALATVARRAEAVGFDAVSVTDHPFPPDEWVRRGGHHSYDPLVALAYVAAATERIHLQTNVLITGYRNAFLAAKSVASVDALSGGRVILGVAAGYLEDEYAALGASFADRNDRLDETIAAMRAAWTGESVDFEGASVQASGHTMLPAPVQHGGPPIWIGGNSTRAIRRAAELGNGWLPFPQPTGASKYTRTADINDMDDLRRRIDLATELAVDAGRTEPLDICFVPFQFSMFADGAPDLDGLRAALPELHDAGVTWLSISLPTESRQGLLDEIQRFADEVIAPGR